MKKMCLLLLMGLLACISQAAVVEYELDCARLYTSTTSAWEHDFDLEVEFSSITSVSIMWSGGFGAASYFNIYTQHYEWADVGLSVGFGYYGGSFRTGYVSGGASTAPEEDLFVNCRTYISGQWDDLLDGTGQLYIDYAGVYTIPEITIVLQGAARISSATLIVEGELVPEPMSLLILLSGGAILLKKRFV